MTSAPLDPEVVALARTEVRRLRTLLGRRRAMPPTLGVGTLAGARIEVPLEATGVDEALAADLVTRALDRLGGPGGHHVWITRTGPLEPSDADLVWCRGTALAFRRFGVPVPPFLVVTRSGWREVADGEERQWHRVRGAWRPPYEDNRPRVDEPDPVEGWPIRF